MKLKHVFLGLFFSTQIFARFLPVYCTAAGDSLSAAQAIERREWTEKCFPLERWRTKLYSKRPDETPGNSFEGYPTFAFMDNEGSIVNSENWFAPTERNADCTLPEGYQIVTYCASN